jgi:hypothetical protein
LPRATGEDAGQVEVVNTNDSGAGSLRAAIDYANTHPGTQVVFHIPPTDSRYANGVFTIRPTSALPVLVRRYQRASLAMARIHYEGKAAPGADCWFCKASY